MRNPEHRFFLKSTALLLGLSSCAWTACDSKSSEGFQKTTDDLLVEDTTEPDVEDTAAPAPTKIVMSRMSPTKGAWSEVRRELLDYQDGRLEQIEIFEVDKGGAATSLGTVSYRYDEEGRLREVRRNAKHTSVTHTGPALGVTRFTRDESGRITWMHLRPDNPGAVGCHRNFFVERQDGFIVAFSSIGPVSGDCEDAPEDRRYFYDRDDRVSDIQNPDSRTAQEFMYAGGRLVRIVHREQGGTAIISERFFTYDDSGRIARSALVEHIFAGDDSGAQVRVDRWVYDAEGRTAALETKHCRVAETTFDPKFDPSPDSCKERRLMEFFYEESTAETDALDVWTPVSPLRFWVIDLLGQGSVHREPPPEDRGSFVL